MSMCLSSKNRECGLSLNNISIFYQALLFVFSFSISKKEIFVMLKNQWFEIEDLYLIGPESCISSPVGVLGLCGEMFK